MSGDGDVGKAAGPLVGLLSSWADGDTKEPKRIPRLRHCGGASLFYSRDEATGLKQRNGQRVVFETDLRSLPDEGRDYIRVVCRDDVHVSTRGVVYGLCARCSELEADNREFLQESKRVRQDPQAKGNRREDVG